MDTALELQSVADLDIKPSMPSLGDSSLDDSNVDDSTLDGSSVDDSNAESSGVSNSRFTPGAGLQAHKKPQVDLRFTLSPSGATYLSRQLAGYPYHVGRLLKKSDTPANMAMLFLQCTSGGLFEDDRIRLTLHAGSGAVAQVKHAAATVVHSMTSGHAQSHVQITVESGAYLEYAANATILFPQASLTNQVELMVHPGAVAVISETYLAHTPKQHRSQHEDNAAMPFERLDTSTTVYAADNKLLARDRLLLTGEVSNKQLSGVTASFDAHGSLFIVSPHESGRTAAETAELMDELMGIVTEAIVAVQPDSSQAYIGAGALPNACGVFVRILAHGGEAIRRVQDTVTAAVRERYAARSSFK